ncbi:hypothetical protein NQD34_001829 [Periophthalmus magnuspinnatus]|nr:hypothetical protein NQD34_001829 [Periophthalmus magnuspinnatus]
MARNVNFFKARPLQEQSHGKVNYPFGLKIPVVAAILFGSSSDSLLTFNYKNLCSRSDYHNDLLVQIQEKLNDACLLCAPCAVLCRAVWAAGLWSGLAAAYGP